MSFFSGCFEEFSTLVFSSLTVMCLDKCVCVCDISWEFAELGVFNPILETIFNYFSAIFSFLLWESKYMHVSLIA